MLLRCFLKFALLAVFAVFSVPISTIASEAITLPDVPVRGCRGERAKLYDECGSQIAIFTDAQSRAKETGKVLLVSYGAEWCIWCHVFEAYVKGGHTELEYTYSDPADEERYTSTFFERANRDPNSEALKLSTYFAEAFVLVHIESRYSKDGYEVLEMTQADLHFDGGLPFIFTLKPNGQFAAAFNSTGIETRREFIDWYRGYDRKNLTIELMRLQKRAIAK